MKSLLIHYRNKYPNAYVQVSEGALDVLGHDGQHLVALRRNGAGQMVDESESLGCVDRHDLAPIPKDARVFKACPKGHLVRDDKADEREGLRERFMAGDKVLSCADLKGKGFEFDQDQRLLSGPAAKPQAQVEG